MINKLIGGLGFLMSMLLCLNLQAQTTAKANQVRKHINVNLPAPRLADNNVVAHRGGSLEKGCPDNTIEALDYAIGLDCYASECDIYLTKDNKVIVAHADKNDKVNGFHPWEATFEEIVKAKKLENGEEIPSFENYLAHVMKAGSTILWIDVKSVKALPKGQSDELAAKCIERASEIVHQMKAANYVEVITARELVQKRAVKAAKGQWACGFMDTHFSPDQFIADGFDWANFEDAAIFYHNGNTKGNYGIDDYLDKGIKVSIYHVDTQQDKDYYVPKADKLHALTTNYPAALLKRLKESKNQ